MNLDYIDPECTSSQDQARHVVSGFMAAKAYDAICKMLGGRVPDARLQYAAPEAHAFFMAFFTPDKNVQEDVRFGLHPLHPARVEVDSLRERVAALEDARGRPFIVERGPWTASECGRAIESDDFTHDALLALSGDFGDDAGRKAYADEIARRLNATDVLEQEVARLNAQVSEGEAKVAQLQRLLSQCRTALNTEQAAHAITRRANS